MNKIAILYICTGEYTVFWKDFYDSYEMFFLVESQKEYYVFTDEKELYQKDNEHVHIIFQESLGWPDNTLKRYHMFDRIKEELGKYDYIYFMNANCLCVKSITEQEFCFPNRLLVVQHPGFYNKNNHEYTYDRNPKSTACISGGEGKYYICGGVNGGATKEFLLMTNRIKERIDRDYENKVVALWHDESHINRYIIDYPDYIMLTPSYCYPEGWSIPFEKKILIRNKDKWINVGKVKGEKHYFIKSIIKRIKK